MRTNRRLAAALAAVPLCLWAVAPAGAQAVVSTGQSFVTARLIHGAPEPGGSRLAGLSLEMADGWKTYWRSPGEAGVPPVFDWSGSRNLRRAEVLWPRPELFESFGLTSVGYAREVVLPLRLVPEDPRRPLELRLKTTLGVCDKICVLEEFDIAETIAPDQGAEDGRIAGALRAVPPDAAESGLTAAECRITGAGDERMLEARLSFARPLSAPVVLVEGPETAWIGEAETRAEGGELTVTATVSMLDKAAWISRSDLRFTVLDEGFASDLRGCAAPPG